MLPLQPPHLKEHSHETFHVLKWHIVNSMPRFQKIGITPHLFYERATLVPCFH